MANGYGVRNGRRRVACPTLVVATTLAAGGAVHAFEIDTGNPDVVIRWDNTLRYNLAGRTHAQDHRVLNSANYDDGDRNFNRGSIVSNRLDVLSEFDFVFRRDYGFRVSAAGWYDDAYNHLDGNQVSTSNHLVNGQPALGLSPYTKRYFRGPSGEFLDAFVFGNFQVADTSLSLKLGQHAVYWGESLLNPIHATSYAQSSIDVGKLLSVPGTEAKELFRPRQQISAQWVATPTLSFATQYFFKWDPVRIPEAGTYMSSTDTLLAGAESTYTPLGRMLVDNDVRPHDRGDWGVAARWRAAALDATLGLYYRNTSDIQPQIGLMPAVYPVPAAACAALGYAMVGPLCYINRSAASLQQIVAGNRGRYFGSYASDIDIYGFSFAKEIAGVSVGVDLNYRHNMPLNSIPVFILPTALAGTQPGAITAIPGAGETVGARGNTWHGVLNLTGIVGNTPLFGSASYIVEAVWNRWDKVTQNPGAFTATSPGYTGIDKATKDYFGLAFNFTPTWFQVFPGVDLQMPMTISQGIKGNSAVAFGGNKGTGNFSIGLGADVYQRYRFDLKYIGYYGDVATNAASQITSVAGLGALLRDRGNVTFTFKTTF